MKLNKFFFGLLMTPAVMMVGCSDYEDTEVASPEADADAIGAYFESSATSEQLSPGQTSFKVVLNRASFSEAVNVPVKITANDDNFFSLSANQFVFDAEKQVSSPITVTFNQSTVELQKTYSLGLQVADGVKDHLYGAGYTDAQYSMVVDYEWKSDSLASTMVKDEYAGTFDKEGALAAVEIAKDFEVVKANPSPDYTKNSLVRISSFFATIGKSKAAGKDHIQFVVDKNHKNPQFLTTEYLAGKEISLKVNTTELSTGMTQKFAEEKLIEAFGIEEEAEEVQKVICINERNAISRQPQIIAGKEYYLDLSSVNGDFEGDWYGEIYSDKNKSEYIGHLKLNHFRSSI